MPHIQQYSIAAPQNALLPLPMSLEIPATHLLRKHSDAGYALAINNSNYIIIITTTTTTTTIIIIIIIISNIITCSMQAMWYCDLVLSIVGSNVAEYKYTAESAYNSQSHAADNGNQIVALINVAPVEGDGDAAQACTDSLYSLPAQAMGPDMVHSLSGIVQQRGFKGLIKIISLESPTFSLAAISSTIKAIPHAPKGWASLTMEYGQSLIQSFANLFRFNCSKWKFPNLILPVEMPTESEIQNHLCQLVRSPPTEKIPYYIGSPLTTHFDHLLHPGKLRNLDHMDSITSMY
ncbi:hypothetical protein M406DRAFT_71386 [Cryphonectria parasitica EP155]|uniref:Uncharacterized protein n=1 Tax=Cryphonectria parasitica (strain ATCC 38755 / EP155) TaxID=660469 RepID=A0A9P5CS91_CRYP1|nr:uncharacterized protein M406DRAFT_71386 [Cryphonectria parasitica EP155]KAF3768332.1 hypothetical protein M406DRAFT_71386 [Cryphonectria parasitica EP155]